METLTGVSEEAAYVRSEGKWDLGASEPCKTHWMVKICQLSDVLVCVWSHVCGDGLILASCLLV